MGRQRYLKSIKVDKCSCGTGLSQPCFFTLKYKEVYKVWCYKLIGSHNIDCHRKIYIEITKEEFLRLRGHKYSLKLR